MKYITVFCGSSAGKSPQYIEIAKQAGKFLAANNIGLVYGGAKIGLMGAVADGVLQGGGKVIGVLPNFLALKEVEHTHLTEMIKVETMHERKMKMQELCDGMIALPGGFGTMEELFEVITWAQLGLHKKPIGLLNVSGFYDHLLSFIQTMQTEQFIKQKDNRLLLVSPEISTLVSMMQNYKAGTVDKILTEKTT